MLLSRAIRKLRLRMAKVGEGISGGQGGGGIPDTSCPVVNEGNRYGFIRRLYLQALRGAAILSGNLLR